MSNQNIEEAVSYRSVLSGQWIAKRANVALSVIIVVGIGLRLFVKLPPDLWEDEIISVTRAMQPAGAVIVDSFRHDIHPPLYFLQLHLWSLLGNSDAWFMANSVFWSICALASLIWVAAKHWGRDAAIAIGAAYAVMPSPVYLADQVRMYAMLATLIIWAIHFAIVVFKDDRSGSGLSYVALIILQAMIVVSHAIGALAVFCIGIYALYLCRKGTRPYKKWLLCYAIMALISVPVAVNAAVHDGNVASSTNMAGIFHMLSASTAGVLIYTRLFAGLAGIFVLAVAVWAGWRTRGAGEYVVFFLAVPLAVALAGNTVQPFFKWNFFSTLEAPFVAIALGLAISGRDARARIPAYACVALLLGVSVETKMAFRESSHYVAISQFLKANYRPGDVVLAPQLDYFHGLAWYMDGHHWGSPLEIAPAPNASWLKVYAALGPNWVRRLGLMPRTHLIDGHFAILSGTDAVSDTPGAHRIWLVTEERADLPAHYPPTAIGGLIRQMEVGKYAQVTLYAPEPAASAQPSVNF